MTETTEFRAVVAKRKEMDSSAEDYRTEDGHEIAAQIEDLKLLLEAYRTGAVKQDKASDT